MHKHSMTSVLALAGSVGTMLGGATSAGAATFERQPIAPEQGVAVFDRGVAEEHLGRRLFGSPYASVVVGNVDIYDVFPYVESRYFIVVSDPEWNRLVVTATGSGKVSAFTGEGTESGPLSGPRGMAVDESGRIYVCDTKNDRVLVLAARQEFDRLELVPAGEIAGLSRPYDVAVSDAGTPFQPDDDRFYVAEAGRNQVSRFVRSENGFVRTATLGGLGSGEGRFAGPMAVAVGREDGRSTDRVYVADAHNRRIVELSDDGSSLIWQREAKHDAQVVTDLETDRFGQVYAVAPREERVSKWAANLEPLAVVDGGADRPRSFHVPFVTTVDHRDGTRARTAEGRGLLVEEWNRGTGLQAWSLGLEVPELAPSPDDPHALRFALTDPASVQVRVERSDDGRVVARRDLGTLASGRHSIQLTSADWTAETTGGAHRWVVEARSTYGDRPVVVASAETWMDGRIDLAGSHPLHLGSHPNPFLEATSLRLWLPSGTAGTVRAEIFDLSGRRVREVAQSHQGGAVELTWDGRDERGRDLGSGVYFYRLEALDQVWSGRMVRVH